MTLEERTRYMQQVKVKVRELSLLLENWEMEQSLVGEILVDEDTYISQHLLAKYTEVTEKTIIRRSELYDIPYAKFGRHRMYKIKDIREAIDKNYLKSPNQMIEDIIIQYVADVKKRTNITAHK